MLPVSRAIGNAQRRFPCWSQRGPRIKYAGDVENAIPIYETIANAGTYIWVPYKRLAIIYHRQKRPSDEERVIRLAIRHLGGGSQSWFVLRLAKILGKRRKSGPQP